MIAWQFAHVRMINIFVAVDVARVTAVQAVLFVIDLIVVAKVARAGDVRAVRPVIPVVAEAEAILEDANWNGSLPVTRPLNESSTLAIVYLPYMIDHADRLHGTPDPLGIC